MADRALAGEQRLARAPARRPLSLRRIFGRDWKIGYLFVLAYDDNGSQPEHYRIDIYEPDGSFLVSTPRVAAARIAVDLARSLYTLNWETLSGPERRTEPSLSMWLPPPPPALGRRKK